MLWRPRLSRLEASNFLSLTSDEVTIVEPIMVVLPCLHCPPMEEDSPFARASLCGQWMWSWQFENHDFEINDAKGWVYKGMHWQEAHLLWSKWAPFLSRVWSMASPRSSRGIVLTCMISMHCVAHCTNLVVSLLSGLLIVEVLEDLV